METKEEHWHLTGEVDEFSQEWCWECHTHLGGARYSIDIMCDGEHVGSDVVCSDCADIAMNGGE